MRGYLTRKYVSDSHGFSVSPNAARQRVQESQIAAIRKIRDSLPDFLYAQTSDELGLDNSNRLEQKET